MIRSPLFIVGAGIVGLMVAFEASSHWAPVSITVCDEGPDPRGRSQVVPQFGATFSGLDARHVSLTETGPWTSVGRIGLVSRSAIGGGWNCLAEVEPTALESSWLETFIATALRAGDHEANSSDVLSLNRTGLAAWNALIAGEPHLFRPVEPSGRLPIICASEADLRNEQSSERDIDPTVPSAVMGIPDALRPLEGAFHRGDLVGGFHVSGFAIAAKTLCMRLITRLESAGVRFRWRTRVDDGRNGDLGLPRGSVIWAGGTSVAATRFMLREEPLLQSVAGCWLEIPNPGFTQAFKILAPEPVNFINATPVGSKLLVSGGYGWVGHRCHGEAVQLVQPLAAAFEASVKRFFCDGEPGALDACARAVCLRPALPSGVPVVRTWRRGARRGVLCVGHAAGGFTQAPEVSRMALNLL